MTVEQNGSTNAGDVEFTLNRDLAVDSVTAGNSVLNTDGLTIANGPSITTGGIDAGGKIIGNVAAGVAGTDAVNVSQLADQGRDLTAKGLNLAGNTGAGHLNLGDTLSVLGGGSTPGSYSGANLKTDVDAAGNLNITLADAPKFGNVTINEGDTGRISGVEDGVDGKDAVNMDQLEDVATAANAGWNVTDAAGNAANIGPAGEVKFTSADGNLAVDQTGADDAGVISLTLNRDLDLDSVTAGNSVLNTDGLTIANGPSITTGGIDAGGKVIGNVAAGVAGTDAVNVSQLTDQGRDLTAKGLNLAGNTGAGHLNLGDTLSVLGGGSTPGSYSGANLKTDVDAAGNLNITLADAPKFGNITVNDSGRISGVEDGVDGKDAVNMDQLDDVATAANAGWNVTDAAGNAANIGPAGEVKFTSADGNLDVAQTGADDAGVISLTLNRDLDLDSVTAGNSVLNTDGLTIANGPSITTGGIDAGGKVIGNVAAGVAGTDAVNVSQLTDQGRDLTAKGLNLAGNTGAGHLNLGDTLSVLGGGSTPGSYSGANLKTDVDAAGNLNITLADAPKFGNITVNDSGRISGVEDGVDGKDAVNMDQLDDVATVANAGWNVTDAAGNAANIGPAGEVKFTSADGNLDVAQTGADDAGVISLTLNRDLDLDSVTAGNSVLNTDGLTIANGPSITTGGIDAGGKVIGNVAPGVAGTDAVNVSQLTDQGRDLTAKGLNLAGNTGAGHLNLGDTLSVLGGGSTPGSYSGANLKTDVDAAGNLNITLADAPKFGNITVNDSGRISGVEDGVDGKDAVNMNQLDDVATVANAGWNVTDAAGNAANIGPAGEVKFTSADGNLDVAQTGADDAGVISLTLNRDLDLDSVTAGNSVLNTDGLTIANGPSITTGGIDAGGKVIGNVAPGVAGTDAVNVSQLTDQGRDLTAKGLNLAGNTGAGHLNLGDTLSVLGGGSTPGSYSGANLKTDVDAAGNLNITLADAPKFGNVTINDGDTGRISGVADGVDGKDAVNMNQLDDVATAANAGWNVTDAAGNAANIGPAGEVKFTSADGNLTVAQTGADDAGVISLTLNRDLDLDSVTAGNSVLNTDGLTIANGPSITTGGIDAGGKVIGNVAAGVAGTDAVNVSQLADQGRDLTAKGLNLAGNSGTGHLNLGDTLSVLGGGSTAGSYSGANLKTEVDAAGNLNITLADAPKFGNVTINEGDTGRISGVEDGVDGKDAVNMNQLDDVATAANAGWNVTDAAGNAANIGPAGEVKFTSADGNLDVAQTGADDAGVINLTLNRDLDLDSVTAGNSVLNTDGLTIANGPSITTGGIDAGGKVIGNVAPGVAGTDAVNKNQLDDVATVANAGWNVTDAAGNAANIGPAGEVKFTSADGNLAVDQTGADDAGVISLTLNRDLDLDSVTAGNSVLNTDGLTIANGPSITTGGIDAGGKVIGNVAAGVAGTDAVNVDQMTSLGSDLTTKGLNLAGNAGSGHLNLGDTLNVLGEGSTAGSYSGGNIRTNVDSFGHLNIEIADSPKFGNITINDGNRITGLADGQNLDDAVNLGQLNEVAASAGGSWNIRDANDLGYAASYEVNSGDTVTFASADEDPTDLSGNLTVQHENGTVTYDLNEDLVLSSVTTGQSVLTNDGLTVGRNVMLGNTGLVINGGPSITVNGIDAGGKKITHVAAGTDATDAVNVSQLKDYGDVIINNIYNTGMKYFHTNSTLADSQATGTDSVAIGPNAVASGDNSIASGNGAISSGSGALANGHNAEATGNASVSIGENSTSKAENSVALGSGAVVTENGKNSVALGAGSVADRENTVSVGSEGNERQITNVAAGEKETDAVNVGQLNGVRDEITNIGGTITNISEGKDGMFQVNNTSNNSRPNPSGKDSLAGGAGAKASGNNSMSVGTNSSASGENSVALGNGSSSKSQNSVSLGVNSIADRDNSVSVGSIGAERQITNVAAGEAPTDAVNVSQLNDAVGTINQNTNNKFGQLKNMVEKQGRKMSAGVAGAMAMAGLPQPYSPGASMVAMGGGTFQGESAVALGVSVISDNGRWVTKLSGSSSSQGDYGVNVGVGYQW
ncbi:YadA-like family protein [Enterobacter pasteurii]|uniref:YadA-like family protein n=1 Tax=Enterobacter pasteurii TaxID=3029761 RepID=UPI00159DDD0A|nr:YadA-like family protein [Enterobacter pasteurii]QLA67173.1 YadA-like family protein [Enterobacter pasteurii]